MVVFYNKKCKAKTKKNKPCPRGASINGYCGNHWIKYHYIKRQQEGFALRNKLYQVGYIVRRYATFSISLLLFSTQTARPLFPSAPIRGSTGFWVFTHKVI